jgi:hypothetical protein
MSLRDGLARLLLLASLAVTPQPAEGALPSVEVVAEAVSSSWVPILPRDAIAAVRGVVLEVLSAPGLAQFVERKPSRAGPPKTDYVLTIQSHIMADAQTHTVYLIFGPGSRDDVPSLHAAKTVVLAGLVRDRMFRQIQSSSREAARRLLRPLRPALEYLAGRTEQFALPAAGSREASPWQWPTLRIPKPEIGPAVRALNAKNPARRTAAVRVLASLAFDEASPRHALERCALQHEDKALRRACLVALRPLSRRIQGTRRVVIEVFRVADDDRLRREAAEQMQRFTGIARAWAIQAWLESAARGRGAGPLKDLGDLPNLDLTIRRCLLSARNDKLHTSKSYRACLELLGPLSFGRRHAILWPFVSQRDAGSPFYLPGAGESENRIGTAWEWAVEALVELMPRWDPRLEAALWHRYKSRLSHTSIDVLSQCGAPSKGLAKRLLEIFQSSGGGRRSTDSCGWRRALPRCEDRFAPI